MGYYLLLLFNIISRRNIPPVTPTPTQTIAPTRVPPTHTPTKTPIPTKTSTPKPTSIPPSPTSGPQSPLFSAVNSYRKNHSIPTLEIDSHLCDIAEKRTQDLVRRGSLDNHSGLENYRSALTDYSVTAEVIYYNSSPPTPMAVVEEGWNNSAPHRERLLDTTVRLGCGHIRDSFAVFLFGTKR